MLCSLWSYTHGGTATRSQRVLGAGDGHEVRNPPLDLVGAQGEVATYHKTLRQGAQPLSFVRHSRHTREQVMPKPFASATRRSTLYATPEWRALRASHLALHPLCRLCQAEGTRTPATFVDHVTPPGHDEAAFWRGPFQSLCRRHSNEKTGREVRARMNRRRPAEAHPGMVG